MKKFIVFVFYFFFAVCYSSASLVKNVATAGTLSKIFESYDITTINSLKLTGNLNVKDFEFFGAFDNLHYLDMQDVKIKAYSTTEKEDCFPSWALKYSSIDTVLLPNSITSIGYASFYNSYIKKLSIPNSVASIGEFAFCHCPLLQSIQLPTSLKSIGRYGFKECNFKRLVLPDSVKTIGEGCFFSMPNLRTIKFSKQLISLGKNILTYVTTLDTIVMSSFKPPLIDSTTFNNCTLDFKLIVPVGSLHLYRESLWGKLNLPMEELTSLNKLSQYFFEIQPQSNLTGKIVVNTDSDWKISNQNDWVTLDKLSGKGRDVITYTIHPNKGLSARNAYAYITFNSNDEQQIHFNQRGLSYSCTISTAGELAKQVPDSVLKVVDRLIINGEINAKDFQTLKTKTPQLKSLDLKGVTVKEYKGIEGTKPGDPTLVVSYPADFIPQNAFQNSSITRIQLPESIIGIDTSAFKNSALDTIVVPDNLKYIRSNSFENSSNLRIFNKGDKVQILESSAFRNCVLLENFNFKKVKSIHPYCFENCSRLANPIFSEDLLKIYHDAFISCSSIKKVILPDSVNTINSYSFAACTALDSFVLGARIKQIGENAFIGSDNLKFIESRSVTPPDFEFNSFSVHFNLFVPYQTKERYQNAAYWAHFATIVENPSGFNFIKAPETLNSAKNSTSKLQFTVTPDLKEEWAISANQPWVSFIPNHGTGTASVTIQSLQNPDFSRRSATITVSFASIPPRDVTIYQNAPLKTIKTEAGKLSTNLSPKEISDLTSLAVSGTINEIDMTFLREKMQQLQSLDLSEASIDSCFYNNTSYEKNRINNMQLLKLSEVRLPKTMTRIGYEAFKDCKSLKTINMGDSIKVIGGNSFINCTSLKYIHISKSLTTISSYAFNGCLSLDSLSLPQSLTFVGDQAFYNCNSLKRVYCFSVYPVSMYSSFNTPKQITIYVLYKALKNYIQSYYVTAFGNVVEMNSIEYYNSPVILNKKKTIGYAIPVSSNTNWNITNSCDWLHLNKISGNGNDTLLVSADENNSQHIRFADLIFTCELQDDVRLRIIQYMGVKKVVAIAEHFKDSITAMDGQYVENMIIEGTLNAYDFRLFNQTFPKLQRLDLRNAKIVEYNGAEGTDPSKQTYYPEDEIPSYSFYNGNRVSALKRVILPENLKSISSNAFQNCLQLDSLMIPSGVQTLKNGALWGTGITNIQIPPISNLNEYLFVNCSKLVSIEIPDIVTSIDWAAFQNCTSLKSVKLSRNLLKIDSYAFNQCTSLKQVYVFQKTPIDLSNTESTFRNIDDQCILYVPYGCKDVYKNQAVWGSFKIIQEMPIDNTETIKSTEKIKLYPNPVSEILSISGIDKPVRVCIYSQHGMKVYDQEVFDRPNIDVSKLGAGIYYVKLGVNARRVKFLKL